MWLPETKSISPRVPFVIVGTKQDLAVIYPTALSLNEGSKFCKRIGGYDHIQCSALNYNILDDEGVKLAFTLAISCAFEEFKKSNPKQMCNCVLL